MEGPSPAKIECDDKGDGSCDVRYWPTEPGEYAVHVLCKNEDIQHSPFMAEIKPAPDRDFYPDKVQRFVCYPKYLLGRKRGTALIFLLNCTSGEGLWPRTSECWSGCWETSRVHSGCKTGGQSTSKDPSPGTSLHPFLCLNTVENRTLIHMFSLLGPRWKSS